MSTQPNPNLNANPPVQETEVPPPAGEVSPRWSVLAQPRDDASPVGSTQAQPSRPVRGTTVEGSGLPELASLLAELQADRLSRQAERSRSDDRLARLEEWMARVSGESGDNGGRPDGVHVLTWYRSGLAPKPSSRGRFGPPSSYWMLYGRYRRL